MRLVRTPQNAVLFPSPLTVGRQKNPRLCFFGFTLVELLLVVSLLGVVVGLILPNLGQGLERMRLSETTSDIAYLLRYGQTRAIVQQRRLRWVWDETLGQYWLEEEVVAEGPPREVNFQPASGRWGRKILAPGSLTVVASVPHIAILPDGTFEPAEVKICLREECRVVSTAIQRRRVQIITDEEKEEGEPAL